MENQNKIHKPRTLSCQYQHFTFFNGFHHYSPYIDYFSINCVPQLAKKGVVVTDSPVPVAKIEFSMHTNNRQPKSMYVLLENNIPFQRFVFTQTNLLSSYWGG
jgi:hypothetical protein